MVDFAHNAVLFTLPFLAVLTLVITVHEFGHFIVARWCGVAVDRFSIGFGKAILSWKDKAGVEWRLGWIPLGGYVRFAGDESVASVPDDDDLQELRKEVLKTEGPAALRRYFHFKPLWQRALVVAAGPVANFLLAIVIFSVLSMTLGSLVSTPRVGTVTVNSPAARAGFQKGDLVLRMDGRPVESFSDLQRKVLLSAEEPIRFDVQRGGGVVQLIATPARWTQAQARNGAGPVGMGYLGLANSGDPADVHVRRLGPVAAVGHGVAQVGDILGTTFVYIKRIFAGRESGDQLSGIVGIAGATGQAATAATSGAPDLATGSLQLLVSMIGISAFISVAVGFANLLPIPVLDGGHLLFYAYEAVARRPLAASVQAAGYRVGFALLIGLMLFVTWNDLQRYRVFHLIGGLFS